MTPVIPAKSTRKHSANPIIDRWLALRYAVAAGLRRLANFISPDNF